MAANRQPVSTAEEALERLKAGNARFVSGRAHFPTVHKEIVAELGDGQHPYATILGCSDSRVPPELVFDAGFGELFVIRVAGNVLGPAVLGSLQYAGSYLRTPLFVVLGHEGCGAVSAAIEWKFRGTAHRSRVQTVLEHIVPALDGLDATQPPDTLLKSGVDANVRHAVREILATPEAQESLATGDMKLVGAVYHLDSGGVDFLE